MNLDEKKEKLKQLKKQIDAIKTPLYMGAVAESVELFKEAINLLIDIVNKEAKQNGQN